jgi:hypothetical protein
MKRGSASSGCPCPYKAARPSADCLQVAPLTARSIQEPVDRLRRVALRVDGDGDDLEMLGLGAELALRRVKIRPCPSSALLNERGRPLDETFGIRDTFLTQRYFGEAAEALATETKNSGSSI